MRLYLFLAILAVISGVTGFLTLAVGILGIIFWALTVVLIFLSWAAYRAREKARGHPDAPPNLPTA